MNSSIMLQVAVLLLADVSTGAVLKTVSRRYRSSVVDWANYYLRDPTGPGSYAFGYDVEDPESNNVQFRNEERHQNGTVIGKYGYMEPDGNIHIVHYIADSLGFRATIEDSKKIKSSRKPTGISNEMVAALKSKELYKQQTLLDKHWRPIDALFQKKMTHSKNRLHVS